jgi:hypothetical protein
MSATRRESGVTLTEVLLVSALVVTMVGAMYGLLRAGTDTYAIGVTRADVENHAHSAVDQVAEALIYSGNTVIQPFACAPLGTSSITYQECTGYEAGGRLWGDPVEFLLVPDPADPDDGKDNNRNGLVDEGMLIRIVHPAGGPPRKTVLTRWVRKYLQGETRNGKDDNGNGLVDERGFSLCRTGEVWTVRLTVEQVDDKGRPLTATAETTLRPRN